MEKIQPKNTEHSMHINMEKKVGEFYRADLVLIASSTGGPDALKVICSELTEEVQRPFLVVQHMPPDFTGALARSLNKKSGLTIEEAKDGDVLEKGKMLIAPGGAHMILSANGIKKTVHMINAPYVNGVRPSADVLFRSVAENWVGSNVLAVILTGMGSDGVAGVEILKKKCNCYCITQSESTCVVYGMPKSVFEAGLSDEAVDLQHIAMRIKQLV